MSSWYCVSCSTGKFQAITRSSVMKLLVVPKSIKTFTIFFLTYLDNSITEPLIQIAATDPLISRWPTMIGTCYLCLPRCFSGFCTRPRSSVRLSKVLLCNLWLQPPRLSFTRRFTAMYRILQNTPAAALAVPPDRYRGDNQRKVHTRLAEMRRCQVNQEL